MQIPHRKIKEFFKKKSVRIAGCVIILLLIFGAIFWGIFHKNSADFSDDYSKSGEPISFTSKLTGLEVSDKSLVDRSSLCVMIENSPEARPQSGLSDAGVVFEAIAEGGITRFLAIYQESNPELIGPIRSLRPYYLEWGTAFDCGLAHVGGSDDALQMIRSGKYALDLDQFYNGNSYWRATDRYAPHNVYSNSENLWALLGKKDKKSSSYDGFSRGEMTSEVTATKIDISISSQLFNVHYDYNSEINSYDRSVGGEPHKDREKGVLSPTVVISLEVNYSLNADGKHLDYKIIGSGKAKFFQGGKVYEGFWKKDSARDQIKFTDANGEEMKLLPGQTWITASTEPVKYS